jgi:hypothetical protein
MPLTFPMTEHLQKQCGGPPGPRPTPSSACRGRQGPTPEAKSGSGGTQADRAVPTIFGGILSLEKTKWHWARRPSYCLGGAAAGLAASGVVAAAGLAGAAGAGAFLSYKAMMSCVISMLLVAYNTGVCCELTSKINA